jgi:iron(III) transport system permease protein
MAQTRLTSTPKTLLVSEQVARQRVSHILTPEDWLMRGMVILAGTWLVVFILLPLYQLVSRSVLDQAGHFVGLANYARYFSTPSLSVSFYHTFYISLASMVITVVLAFTFAYALTRTAIPGKSIFRILAMLPLFAPSLLHAIAFIYLFGRQGFITTGGFGYFAEQWGFNPGLDIGLYQEPIGIILAEVFYLFPHALIILTVSLRLADARLYEAATALGTSPWRTFFTITLPNAKYGLLSTAFVCFTLVFTDFGIPKVIGGSYNVLATDIYKQVIGQQNFVMGATVSVLLLTPTVIGFVVNRIAQRRQVALLTGRAVALQPRPDPVLDRLMFGFCVLVVLAICVVIGTALLASLITAWPYNLSLGWRHYDFGRVGGGGLDSYWNSLRMAFYTAVIGTAIAFANTYLIEKGKGLVRGRALLYFLSTLPVALPGLVIGLAYIFFFNAATWTLPLIGWRLPNPFNFLYGTMGILVLSTIVHFYTVAFFTAMTALKQLDPEFEAVSASLRVPFYRTFRQVTMPVSLPAILDISLYFFVNAMTTVSAVIFLYSAHLKLASVAVVNMDDAGDTAPAAAMSMLIFFTCLGVRLMYGWITSSPQSRTQAWTKR